MDHFYEDLNPSGLEILFLCNREHVLILDTLQVIDLKELIEIAFESLLRPAVCLVAWFLYPLIDEFNFFFGRKLVFSY